MGTMSLPVKLSKAERLALALEQATEQRALEIVEAEKKLANNGFNAKIKEHKASIHDRNEAIDTGIIDREVEVRQLLDVDKGRVKVVRLDTYEIVSDRPMDDEERQLRLEGTGPTKTDKTADEERERADEERDAATPEEAEQIRAERLTEEENERIMMQVAGLMLMATIEAAEGGDVTMRVEHDGIVAEATAESETQARVELSHAVLAMVQAAAQKKAREAAAAVVATYSPAVTARADAYLADAVVTQELDMFVARYETPTHVMEGSGATADDARAALRAKMLEKFAAEEAKLRADGGLSNPPKTGLKAPKGAKGKAAEPPPAPDPELDVCDGEGCEKPHVHDAPDDDDDGDDATEGGEKPLAF
jgi:hypothetical protein